MRALFAVALAACAAPSAPSRPVAPAPCAGLAECTAAVERMRTDPIGRSAERYVQLLDLACHAGDAESCIALAEAVTNAPTLPRDDARAAAAYEAGCALGDGVACFDAAGDDAFARSMSPAGSDRMARARAALTAGCDAHVARSCGVLAVVIKLIDDDRDRGALLEQETATLLANDCNAGVADRCEMAVREFDLLGNRDHSDEIRQLLHRGCALGAGNACLMLAGGDSHFADPALTADDRADLERVACTHGRAAGCLAEGQDPALFARGIALAEAGCTLALDDECEVTARLVGSSALSADEAARLEALATRACEHHDALVCNALADALEHGPVARRDSSRIAELKLHACTWGYPFACPSPAAAMRQ